MSFLQNLPKRGNLTHLAPGKPIIGPNPPRYIPSQSTLPPKDQIVVTDPTNILIRSLSLNRKSETAQHRQDLMRGKAVKEHTDRWKRRSDDRVPPPPKRARNEGESSGVTGSDSRSGVQTQRAYTQVELNAFDILTLREIVRRRSLTIPADGPRRKEEYVRIILEDQARQ